jgi:L-ascorbate metabolism protein UlaG (beta-lactamase superfamily)
MLVTKYIHSCLLLEEGGEQMLFDPGTFTFKEGLVKPEQFRNIKWMVVTHTHPDHFDVPAIKKIIELSGATIIGNDEIAEGLRSAGIPVTLLEDGKQTCGAFRLTALPAKHQPILSATLPKNTSFLVNETLLNGGDSFDPILETYRGIETLAVPVQAPYLTELHVMDYIMRIHPKRVIPIHDGYAKDFFIEQRYDNYVPECKKLSIEFLRLAKPGDSVTL